MEKDDKAFYQGFATVPDTSDSIRSVEECLMRLTKKNKDIIRRALKFAIRDRLLYRDAWEGQGCYAEAVRSGCNEAVAEFRDMLEDLQ